MRHAASQIRNLLKCNFVNQIVVSNHNPEVHMEDLVSIRDRRVVYMNQPVHRGCGFRWLIAADLGPDYLIVIDDDIWLFPQQLANLFQHLVNEPDVPHGFTGMLHLANDEFEYREREERTVDYLCEVYAVTKEHLDRYRELENRLARNESVAKAIAASHDFMVISQTGNRNPKIHYTSRLFRSPTFNQPGVAVHKENSFDRSMPEIYHALHQVRVSTERYERSRV
jgi:hypothetical protein